MLEVGEMWTDCAELFGCSRRGLLFKRRFKSQVEAALIQICFVPLSSVL